MARLHPASCRNGIQARAKVGVDCYSCHSVDAKDPATFDHYGQKIAVIVTPNYCGSCHAKELRSLRRIIMPRRYSSSAHSTTERYKQ